MFYVMFTVIDLTTRFDFAYKPLQFWLPYGIKESATQKYLSSSGLIHKPLGG